MILPSRGTVDKGNYVRILALASQKGGSGKTTLSGHLAVQAQNTYDQAAAGAAILEELKKRG